MGLFQLSILTLFEEIVFSVKHFLLILIFYTFYVIMTRGVK